MLTYWRTIIRLALVAPALVPGSAAAAKTFSLLSGDDLAGIAQQAADGDVIRLQPGRYSGPVVVEGKRVIIKGPGGGGAVIAPGQSNVLLGVQNGGQAEVSGVRFETSPETPLALFAKDGKISCSDCIIESTQTQPIYIEDGTLLLAGGTAKAAGQHVIVAWESAINLEGAQVEAENGSPLSVTGATEVSILNSRLSGHERTSISGTAPRLRIINSEITTNYSYGLHFEGGGEIDIEDGRISGGMAGLVAQLGSGARMRISGLDVRSPDSGLYFEHSGGETTRVALDAVQVSAGKGTALRAVGGVEVVASGSTFVSGGNYGVSAEGADVRLRLERSVSVASAYPAIVSYEGPGRIEIVDSIVVPGAPFHHGVEADDDTQRLSRAAADDATLADELKSGAAQFLAGGEIGLLVKAVQQARAAASAITMVRLEVTDGIGTSLASPFTVVSAETLEAIAQSEDGAAIPVPPGRYFVEWRGDAAYAAEMEVKGGSTPAQITIPEALWLDANFFLDDEKRLTLFRPVTPKKVRDIFRATAYNFAYHSRTARRSGATDAEIAAALEAARRIIQMKMAWPKDGTQADKDRYAAWSMAVVSAYRALASAGTAEDAALIARSIDAEGSIGPDIPLMHLAYLEHRLGLLDDGILAGFADGQDPDMAGHSLVLLDYYGVADANERLFLLMSDGERFDGLQYTARERTAQRLVGLDDPRVREIADAAFQRAFANVLADEPKPEIYHRFFNQLTLSFAAYLAVFGSADQKRAVVEAFDRSGPAWKGLLAGHLAMIALDPLPFIEEFIDDTGMNIVDTGSPQACAAWRLRSNAESSAHYEMLVDAYARNRGDAAHRKNKESTGSSEYINEKAEYSRGAFIRRLLLSPCQPSEAVAGAYYNDILNADTVLPGNWFPAFRTEEALSELLRKRPFERAPLEAAPLETALAAWRSVDHLRWSAFRDERMALFRAFTKSGDDELNGNIDDGIERRVYVLRHVVPDAYSGALHGHLEVRPIREDGKLVIGLRLRQAPWYNSYGGLADAMSTNGDRNHWAHHAYVMEPLKLIERIALTREGKSIPLSERGRDPDGFSRFATGLPAGDLSGLELDVGLALFDDRRAFQFDLFASRLARDGNRGMLQ